MTWNPFKKDKAQEPVEEESPAKTVGKGRPTPKMKQAQARNLRPLVPPDRKASAKAAKERIRKREDEEYEAMRTGDINRMPKAERLPWRVYIRDYVDARRNLGEFFIPVAFVMLLGSILVTTIAPQLSVPMMILLYVYLIAVIIDVAVMWRKLKKKLIEKYPLPRARAPHRMPGAARFRCAAGVCPNRAAPSAATGRSDSRPAAFLTALPIVGAPFFVCPRLRETTPVSLRPTAPPPARARQHPPCSLLAHEQPCYLLHSSARRRA